MIDLRILERRADTPPSDSCVTPAQGMLAHEIARSGGSTTRALAKRLGTSSSAVTQLVNGLEAEGILRRADDPDDGRRSRIELTGFGEKIDSAAPPEQELRFRRGVLNRLDQRARQCTDKKRQRVSHQPYLPVKGGSSLRKNRSDAIIARKALNRQQPFPLYRA